jgi:hypothetical protein
MKKLLTVLPLIIALSLVSCGSDQPVLPKLDGSFTGFGCTISYPRTYKVDSAPDGIIINGNFNMGMKVVKNASSKVGSAYQLLLQMQANDKKDTKKKSQMTNRLVKKSGIDAVQVEGFDDMKRYSYTIYVPVQGGIFILYQEPAFLNEPLMELSHLMANTWEIVDPQYFVGR